jgi:Domain of unknown function (DUF1836).
MNFSIEEIEKLANEVALNKEINLIDIPCVDLYMDQVTTLFEDKLSHLKRDNEESILTKTMINNYAKAKILTPVKNKKYNKQQIITLILVYHLKQILSLEDINLILTPLVENLNSNSIPPSFVDDLYQKFLSIKENQFSSFSSDIIKCVEELKSPNEGSQKNQTELYEMLLTVLTLINSAILQKRMAEKLIDTYLKSKKD